MNPEITTQRHAGPPLWLMAVLYTALFNAGLYPVTALAGRPYWPGPWEPPSVIVPYFQTHQSAVLLCAFLQIGAVVCFGIFSVSVVSRLRFLGVRAAGAWIALLGGVLTVTNGFAAGFLVWVMVHPGIGQDATLLLALYHLSYAFGGPGFSMPMGLFIAGVSVTSAFMKLLPRWIVVFGLILAVAGELSWFNIISPAALFLIPLTRFPGFVWLIAMGFALPKSRALAGPRLADAVA
jgi:hypothetical protein